MNTLRNLKNEILNDGVDMRIDESDWLRIRALLPHDGMPTFAEWQTLVELRTEARSVCPAFDAYFFPKFREFLLTDNRISLSEHFQLVRLLYGGGGIDANERRFLHDLRRDLREVTPEFEAMYKQTMRD